MGWASEELAKLELGDVRLDLRLRVIVELLSQRMSESLPESFGSWAEVKGAYRLWGNSRVCWQDILKPHIARTAARAWQHPVVLVLQDTMEANLTHHPGTSGLGHLGRPNSRGVLMHSCLVVTPQSHILGLLDQQLWTRPPETFGKKHRRHELPTAEKESQRWLRGLEG
jgi:hypothetical protein